jgi:8-oxo-dGTP pyrophosphatase MutT (NUDIX family)
LIVERRAARALLIAERSVLLIEGHDPARPEAGAWWLTPGGGIDDDEPIAVAAAREVLEETGLRVAPEQLGSPIATRVAEFEFDGREYRQSEWFFAMRVERFVPQSDRWDDIEQRALFDHRWWDLEELAATSETIYPSEVASLVRAALDGEIREPIRLSGS